jgi:alkanesulfonate monooxygenase SsuD/methylene tetrahydromethanopterin reductase-like flavin-dependent oxidoreductase (luciferase family)
VVRRLWDSWEDDAEIRHAATGRFIDRDRLHYIDFAGRWFRVKGPSITPRPPQGQPPVSLALDRRMPYPGVEADIGYVTPRDADDARALADDLPARHVLADLVVFLDADARAARGHRRRLDDLDGAAYAPDAAVFAGTPAQLADLLLSWRTAGLSGFRLRPGRLPTDLVAITRGLIPLLQARGAFRREYEAGTLRGLLGLSRPANRYRKERVG